MDVTGLYPNCKVAQTTKKVEEAVIKCGLEFENINLEFLTKFVSVLTKGRSGNVDLDVFLQTPKVRTTLNSFIKRQAENQFQGPPLEPAGNLTVDLTRRLLAIAASRSVKTVMENHYFTIGGNIYKQTDGSAIGLDISVETASLYMSSWDATFLSRLNRLGIKTELYKRYVDDIVIILRGINQGWYYCVRKKKLVYDPEHPSKDTPEDKRTVLMLQEIVNQIDDNIQMTCDTPSDNQSGRLPVLDLELFVVNNQVSHSFYSKPVSSPYTIKYKSAIQARTKRDSLLQEGIRRYRNVSDILSDLD